ncbi:MAG: hypothetical protein JJE21_02775 [Spirochaetaceae bacterium]|nr:hypothetical protein [Spirochaetaceae bacterium]
MNKTYKELYKQPKNSSREINSKDLEEMKKLAKELGANNIGFTVVNPSYIFDDKVIIYPNAIVFVMEMALKIINTAPSKAAEKKFLEPIMNYVFR